MLYFSSEPKSLAWNPLDFMDFMDLPWNLYQISWSTLNPVRTNTDIHDLPLNVHQNQIYHWMLYFWLIWDTSISPYHEIRQIFMHEIHQDFMEIHRISPVWNPPDFMKSDQISVHWNPVFFTRTKVLGMKSAGFHEIHRISCTAKFHEIHWISWSTTKPIQLYKSLPWNLGNWWKLDRILPWNTAISTFMKSGGFPNELRTHGPIFTA